MKSSPPDVSQKPHKIRKNIMLTSSAIEKCKQLATAEHRNASNWLEVMIHREHKKLTAEPAALLA